MQQSPSRQQGNYEQDVVADEKLVEELMVRFPFSVHI